MALGKIGEYAQKGLYALALAGLIGYNNDEAFARVAVKEVSDKTASNVLRLIGPVQMQDQSPRSTNEKDDTEAVRRQERLISYLKEQAIQDGKITMLPVHFDELQDAILNQAITSQENLQVIINEKKRITEIVAQKTLELEKIYEVFDKGKAECDKLDKATAKLYFKKCNNLLSEFIKTNDEPTLKYLARDEGSNLFFLRRETGHVWFKDFLRDLGTMKENEQHNDELSDLFQTMNKFAQKYRFDTENISEVAENMNGSKITRLEQELRLLQAGKTNKSGEIVEINNPEHQLVRELFEAIEIEGAQTLVTSTFQGPLEKCFRFATKVGDTGLQKKIFNRILKDFPRMLDSHVKRLQRVREDPSLDPQEFLTLAATHPDKYFGYDSFTYARLLKMTLEESPATPEEKEHIINELRKRIIEAGLKDLTVLFYLENPDTHLPERGGKEVVIDQSDPVNKALEEAEISFSSDRREIYAGTLAEFSSRNNTILKIEPEFACKRIYYLPNDTMLVVAYTSPDGSEKTVRLNLEKKQYALEFKKGGSSRIETIEVKSFAFNLRKAIYEKDGKLFSDHPEVQIIPYRHSELPNVEDFFTDLEMPLDLSREHSYIVTPLNSDNLGESGQTFNKIFYITENPDANRVLNRLAQQFSDLKDIPHERIKKLFDQLTIQHEATHVVFHEMIESIFKKRFSGSDQDIIEYTEAFEAFQEKVLAIEYDLPAELAIPIKRASGLQINEFIAHAVGMNTKEYAGRKIMLMNLLAKAINDIDAENYHMTYSFIAGQVQSVLTQKKIILPVFNSAEDGLHEDQIMELIKNCDLTPEEIYDIQQNYKAIAQKTLVWFYHTLQTADIDSLFKEQEKKREEEENKKTGSPAIDIQSTSREDVKE